jgi:hypothetical protein
MPAAANHYETAGSGAKAEEQLGVVPTIPWPRKVALGPAKVRRAALRLTYIIPATVASDS